jgi:hypothetical protein
VPKLEWFQIYRGTEEAGELLSAFEMFEVIFNVLMVYNMILDLICNQTFEFIMTIFLFYFTYICKLVK